ncbi:hypothetical protein OIU76_025113 [Salix suchowensis]|nr:hypothetical protein OIU76_025113 [Salix suchowensis]
MAASFSLLFIHHHHCCHFPPQILPARHLHSLLQLLPHLLHQWFHHWDEQAAALTSHPLYMHEETPRWASTSARCPGVWKMAAGTAWRWPVFTDKQAWVSLMTTVMMETISLAK